MQIEPWDLSASSSEASTAVEILDLAHPRARDAIGASVQGSDPRRAFRVVLSHAEDLEEALHWKNTGRADRYLHWPAERFVLEASIPQLLDEWLEAAGVLDVLALRLVSSAEELAQVIAFRYEVYVKGSFSSWAVSRNPHPIDVDAYDRRAHIFGLWRRVSKQWRLVGTVRVVGDEPGPHGDQLDELELVRPEWSTSFSRVSPENWPILQLGFDRSEVLRCLKSDEAVRSVVEIGKHAVAQEHRTRDTDRLQLEGVTAFMLAAIGPMLAVAAAPRPLARAFRPFGFTEIPGAGNWSSPTPSSEGGPVPFVALCARVPEDLFPEFGRRTEVLAAQMASTGLSGGQVCFCARYPTCLSHGYRQGNLLAAGIFCPAQYLERRRVL